MPLSASASRDLVLFSSVEKMTASQVLSDVSLLRWLCQLWAQIWPSCEVKRLSRLSAAKIGVAKAVATLSYKYGAWQGKQKMSSPQPCGRRGPVQERHQIIEGRKRAGQDPSLAVVIPVLVRHPAHLQKLKECLRSVRLQTHSPTIFLVDDGSQTPVSELLSVQEQDGVTVLRSDVNRGPAAARNLGLQEARAREMEYVLFTDSDCLPETGWVETMLMHFKQHPQADLLGGTTCSLRRSYVDQFHDIFGTLNGRALPDGTLLYTPSCNMALRLQTVSLNFKTVFPEAAFEDVDFCVQAKKEGACLRFVASACVVHHYNSTLLGLAKQFARYGRSAPLMEQLHPEYSSWLSASEVIAAIPPLEELTGHHGACPAGKQSQSRSTHGPILRAYRSDGKSSRRALSACCFATSAFMPSMIYPKFKSYGASMQLTAIYRPTSPLIVPWIRRNIMQCYPPPASMIRGASNIK